MENKIDIKLCSKCKKRYHKIKYDYCYECNQKELEKAMAGVEKIEEEEDKIEEEEDKHFEAQNINHKYER